MLEKMFVEQVQTKQIQSDQRQISSKANIYILIEVFAKIDNAFCPLCLKPKTNLILGQIIKKFSLGKKKFAILRYEHNNFSLR